MDIWSIIWLGITFAWVFNLQTQVNALKDEIFYLKNKE